MSRRAGHYRRRQWEIGPEIIEEAVEEIAVRDKKPVSAVDQFFATATAETLDRIAKLPILFQRER